MGWLQSDADHRLDHVRLDLPTLQSPSSIDVAILRRAGIVPLLAKYETPSDAGLDRWMAAHFGGWQSAEAAGAGIFFAIDVDEVLAYTTNFGLIGGWSYCIAASLVEQDARADVLALARKLARKYVAPFLERATYAPDSLGCTLCEVLPNGDELPIEVDEPGHTDGSYRIRPVTSTVPLARSVYDVLLSALRTGHVPDVVSATRLLPVGRQPGLRRSLPLYGGIVVDLRDDDPVQALARLRVEAKTNGDGRLAALTRVALNAMVYGNFARLDQVRTRSGRRWVLTERHGDYAFPPLAASVPALTRLFVGLAEHLSGEVA